jgi:preprotein translocase subunit YajC
MSAGGLIVIVVLFALFWLLLVRPQRRRTHEQETLIESLEAGDEIVSAGGLYGVITDIEGDALLVEIADGLVVRMAKNAVVGLVERDDEDEHEDHQHEDEALEEGATVSVEDEAT